MQQLPFFEYRSPKSLNEALRLISERPGYSALVAGGTDLLPNLMRRQTEPRLVVSLEGIRRLEGIRGDERRGLVIGANTRLDEIARDKTIAKYYTALGEASELVGSPQIRSAATVGGNLCQDTRCDRYNAPFWWRRSLGPCLKSGGDVCQVAKGSKRCWAIASSDLAPAAIALGARIRLAGPKGKRVMNAADFYLDDGLEHLNKSNDEIVTEVLLPPARGLRSAFVKARRRGSIDFSMLNVAAAARFDGRDVVDLRLVVGAVGSSPLQVKDAERALKGRELTSDSIKKAGDIAYAMVKPMDNSDLPVAYRKLMVRVHVRRALGKLILPDE